MKVSEIKENSKYKQMMRSLNAAEYLALKIDISEKGVCVPVIVNGSNVLLDGHHRVAISKELEIPEVPSYTRQFDNPLDEFEFVVLSDVVGRQANDYTKAKSGILYLEPNEARREEQKQKDDGVKGAEYGKLGGRGNKKNPLPEIEGKGFKLREQTTTEIVAKKVGVSRGQYERVQYILRHIFKTKDDKIIIKDGQITYTNDKCKEYDVSLDNGDRSINNVYGEFNKGDNPEEGLPPPPTGQYNIIYADPPWDYFNPRRGSPGMHYQTMSFEEISNMPIPAADSAVLFLWATNPWLPQIIDVMKKWGFDYLTNFSWNKGKIGLGYWNRGQHELLLVGRKGDVKPPTEDSRFSSVINAASGEHSKKPDEAYEIIEKMFPTGKYIELFARNEREGWESWGTDVK